MARQPIPRLLDKNEDRKRILANYKASLMSDTKWQKVFVALGSVDPDLRVIVKWVRVEDGRPMSLPVLETPFSRAWAYFEARPEPLRSIEWLEIPYEDVQVRRPGFAPVRRAQPVAAVRTAMEALGKLPVAESPTGVRVIGHLANGVSFPAGKTAL